MPGCSGVVRLGLRQPIADPVDRGAPGRSCRGRPSSMPTRISISSAMPRGSRAVHCHEIAVDVAVWFNRHVLHHLFHGRILPCYGLFVQEWRGSCNGKHADRQDRPRHRWIARHWRRRRPAASERWRDRRLYLCSIRDRAKALVAEIEKAGGTALRSRPTAAMPKR